MINRNSLLALACLAISTLGLLLATAQADDRNLEPKEHTKDTLATVRERVEEKKAVIVDVRDLVEWNAGHVQGAVFLPWRELQEKITEEQVNEKLSKEKIIYTHCAVGYRSLRAAKILSRNLSKPRLDCPHRPNHRKAVPSDRLKH
jgi:rhodanese-related sulfurtransferase